MCSHISSGDCLIPEVSDCLLGKLVCTEAKSLAPVSTAAGLGGLPSQGNEHDSQVQCPCGHLGCSYPPRSPRPKLCDLKDCQVYCQERCLRGCPQLSPQEQGAARQLLAAKMLPWAEGCLVGAEQMGAQQLSIKEWPPWGT